jgi:hypothetical protein
MFYYFGLIFSLFCSSWGHIQKATLKFSAIHHKLKKNRPLGLVMSDLLADTKKAYYKQEGKQFMYEPAWNCLKKSDKWKTLAQSQGNLQETPSDSPPEPPTSATQPNKHHANTTIGVDSDSSWKLPLGVASTKRLMEEEDLSSKKLKVIAERSNDYCDRTSAMKKTNEIHQKVAQAKVNQSNMEIMSKQEEDFPDEIS